MSKESIQNLINQTSGQKDNSRYQKEKKNDFSGYGKKNYSEKDPVVEWLESQEEIEKVHLDSHGWIIGADYK